MEKRASLFYSVLVASGYDKKTPEKCSCVPAVGIFAFVLLKNKSTHERSVAKVRYILVLFKPGGQFTFLTTSPTSNMLVIHCMLFSGRLGSSIYGFLLLIYWDSKNQTNNSYSVDVHNIAKEHQNIGKHFAGFFAQFLKYLDLRNTISFDFFWIIRSIVKELYISHKLSYINSVINSSS